MKSKSFKLFVVLVVCLLLPSLLSACGAPVPAATQAPAATEAPAATQAPAATEAPAVIPTIRFATNWLGGDAKAADFDAALKAYMESHKDSVNIVVENTPGDEHRNKVKVDLAGNNLSDVLIYWVGEPTLRPFIDAGAIVDMGTLLAKSTKTTSDQWANSMLDAATADDKLWILPMEAFKCFTLYNKSIFDQYKVQPPKSYEELKKVAAVFNENGIVPLDMGSKGGNPGHLFYNQLLLQFENGLSESTSTGTTYTVDTPSFNKAAAVVEQMVKDKIFPADTIANGDWGPSIVLYNEGKAAMLFSCPWMIGAIKPEIAEVSEVMDLPVLDGSAVDPTTFNVGGVTMGVMVNKASFEDSAKQAAIVDFVDYLVSDEMFNYLGHSAMMPAKKVTLSKASSSPLFGKIVDFTKEQDTYPIIWMTLPNSATQEAFSSGMDELFAGAPATEVIQKLNAAVQKEKQ